MRIWRPESRTRCGSCWRDARWFALGMRWCDVHAPKWVRW